MATRQARTRAISTERRFFAGMALAMVASIVVGFLPSYYLRGIAPPYHPLPTMKPLMHLHGALFTAWMLLFLVQTLLVTNGRTDIHRKLGLTAVAMLPAMIVVGMLSGLYQVLRASGPPVIAPLSWLAVPMLSVPVYGGLIAWALIKRRDPQSHKRLMMMAMIEMTTPGLGRIPWPAIIPPPVALFGFSDLFIVAMMIWDRKRLGHVHRATWIGTMAVVGAQLIRLATWDSGPWLAFARWSVGWVA